MASKNISVFTSQHNPSDNRILYRQCYSLVKNGYDVHYYISGKFESNKLNDKINVSSLASKRGDFLLFSFKVLIMTHNRNSINIIHDPQLLPIAFLKSLFGYKFVYDIHEDYSTKPFQSSKGSMLWKKIKSYSIGLVEKLFSSNLHKIIAEEYYSYRFPKATLIPNTCAFDESIKSSYSPNKILYTGNLSIPRGGRNLISLAEENIDLEFHLVGKVSQDVMRQISKLALPNIVIYNDGGYVSPEFIREMYAQEWLCGICLWNKTDHQLEKLPTKFYEYAFVGLPIICSDFPLWQQFVNTHNMGYSAKPDDLNAALAAMVALKNKKIWQQHHDALMINREKFSWDKSESDFLGFLNKISI